MASLTRIGGLTGSNRFDLWIQAAGPAVARGWRAYRPPSLPNVWRALAEPKTSLIAANGDSPSTIDFPHDAEYTHGATDQPVNQLGLFLIVATAPHCIIRPPLE